MTGRNGLSKGSRTTLEAVARYRLQRRFGHGWLIGDRRVSSSTIANLERASLIREISLDGTPALILTDEGKRRLAQTSER